MSEKLGESNIIGLFQDILKDHVSSYETKVKFIESTMCGKDDKKFADYFASLNSINILIEFKEVEKDIKTEKNKPLRKKLCEEIGKFINITRKGHFIAWSDSDKKDESLEIFLDNYIFRVSNVFELSLNKVFKTEYLCKDFIDSFIKKKIGLKVKEFSCYIQFLKELAEDDDGGNGLFNAKLLSYDNGRLVQNEIKKGDFLHLLNLIKIENEKIRTEQRRLPNKKDFKKPKPKDSGSPSLMRAFPEQKESPIDKKAKLLSR